MTDLLERVPEPATATLAGPAGYDPVENLSDYEIDRRIKDQEDGVVDSVDTDVVKINGTDYTANLVKAANQAPTTPGTSQANKAVVLGPDSKIDTFDVTSLKIGGTAISSTAAQLDAAAVNVLSGTVVAAGSTITNAAPLTYARNIVTGANDAKGVKLASSSSGILEQVVINSDSTHGLLVYPNTTLLAIGDNAVGVPVVIGPKQSQTFTLLA